jgi:hypothetical protein
LQAKEESKKEAMKKETAVNESVISMENPYEW